MTLTPHQLTQALIEKELGACVSTLINGIAALVPHCSDEQFHDAFSSPQSAFAALFQPADYGKATHAAIDESNLAALKAMAEFTVSWRDCLDGIKSPNNWEDDSQDEPEFLAAVRGWIKAQLAPERYREFCDHFDVVLENELSEPMEYWIVSERLADALATRGEVVGRFAGLALWGRRNSDKPIDQDPVLQAIAASLRINSGLKSA